MADEKRAPEPSPLSAPPAPTSAGDHAGAVKEAPLPQPPVQVQPNYGQRMLQTTQPTGAAPMTLQVRRGQLRQVDSAGASCQTWPS